jgi:hypothetical protein
MQASEKNKTQEKRDALVRNDVHWAGQSCILNYFFSGYDRSRIRPCRGDRRRRAMTRMMGTLSSRCQT